MENQTSNLEELNATNEPNVTYRDLLEEILPILKNDFIGEFAYDGNGIIYRMLNGQKFKLTLEEVA